MPEPRFLTPETSVPQATVLQVDGGMDRPPTNDYWILALLVEPDENPLQGQPRVYGQRFQFDGNGSQWQVVFRGVRQNPKPNRVVILHLFRGAQPDAKSTHVLHEVRVMGGGVHTEALG